MSHVEKSYRRATDVSVVVLPWCRADAVRRRASFFVVLSALGLAVAAAWGALGTVSPARAEEAGETSGPIWTNEPVRIDRRLETRERLPAVEPQPILRLRVSDFPRVEEDASFLAAGRRWRIADVRLPETSRICTLADGRRWACGLRARARFSGLIAGARLECDPPTPPDAAIPAVDCRLSGRSVAERLVEGGWAEADAEAPTDLLERAERARAAGRGLHAETIPP